MASQTPPFLPKTILHDLIKLSIKHFPRDFLLLLKHFARREGRHWRILDTVGDVVYVKEEEEVVYEGRRFSVDLLIKYENLAWKPKRYELLAVEIKTGETTRYIEEWVDKLVKYRYGVYRKRKHTDVHEVHAVILVPKTIYPEVHKAVVQKARTFLKAAPLDITYPLLRRLLQIANELVKNLP
ncbi:MAG: hypothetical protein J7K15_10300 [Deltaproteobacteria bacterium]|nr:hypothetical protein [Deltaproteobacteria bacterium]